MALTSKDIILIKQALQPEFTKVKGEIIHIVINEISGTKMEMKALEERLGKRINLLDIKIDCVKNELGNRIDFLEGKIERRIELSKKNIIETQGELHAGHEKRILRIEKAIVI